MHIWALRGKRKFPNNKSILRHKIEVKSLERQKGMNLLTKNESPQK